MKDLDEERFYELGRRIAEFDTTKQSAANSEALLSQMKEELFKQKSVSDSRIESLEKSNFFLQESNNSLSEKLQFILSGIDGLKEENRKLQASLAEPENLRKKDAELLKEHARELVALKGILNLLENKVHDQGITVLGLKRSLEDVCSRIASLPNYQPIFDALRSEIQSAKVDTKSSLAILKDNLDSLHENLCSSIGKTNSYIDSKFESFTKYVDAKLESLPKIDASDFIPAKELLSINHKIQSFSLDAKNALLKSNNNEMQNTIHGKKIENIQLVLKQHELSK